MARAGARATSLVLVAAALSARAQDDPAAGPASWTRQTSTGHATTARRTSTTSPKPGSWLVPSPDAVDAVWSDQAVVVHLPFTMDLPPGEAGHLACWLAWDGPTDNVRRTTNPPDALAEPSTWGLDYLGAASAVADVTPGYGRMEQEPGSPSVGVVKLNSGVSVAPLANVPRLQRSAGPFVGSWTTLRFGPGAPRGTWAVWLVLPAPGALARRGTTLEEMAAGIGREHIRERLALRRPTGEPYAASDFESLEGAIGVAVNLPEVQAVLTENDDLLEAAMEELSFDADAVSFEELPSNRSEFGLDVSSLKNVLMFTLPFSIRTVGGVVPRSFRLWGVTEASNPLIAAAASGAEVVTLQEWAAVGIGWARALDKIASLPVLKGLTRSLVLIHQEGGFVWKATWGAAPFVASLALSMGIVQAANEYGGPKVAAAAEALAMTFLFDGDGRMVGIKVLTRWIDGEQLKLMDVGKLLAVKKQVAEHKLFSWVLGDHDRHLGNYRLMRDGRVVGIDAGLGELTKFRPDRLDNVVNHFHAHRPDLDRVSNLKMFEESITYQDVLPAYENAKRIFAEQADAVKARLREAYAPLDPDPAIVEGYVERAFQTMKARTESLEPWIRKLNERNDFPLDAKLLETGSLAPVRSPWSLACAA